MEDYDITLDGQFNILDLVAIIKAYHTFGAETTMAEAVEIIKEKYILTKKGE